MLRRTAYCIAAPSSPAPPRRSVRQAGGASSHSPTALSWQQLDQRLQVIRAVHTAFRQVRDRESKSRPPPQRRYPSRRILPCRLVRTMRKPSTCGYFFGFCTVMTTNGLTSGNAELIWSRMMAARLGRMPTTSVRRRISRFSRWGLLVLNREGGERRDVGTGGGQQLCRGGEHPPELGGDPPQLSGDLFGGWLSEDRADQRGHHALGALVNPGEEIPDEVCPASLPRRPRQDGLRDLNEPGVVVGDHQAHPLRPPGNQVPEERRPSRPVLAGQHVHAQDLPVPVGVDRGGHHRCHVGDPAPLPALYEGWQAGRYERSGRNSRHSSRVRVRPA
jgi:hypothetical protein